MTTCSCDEARRSAWDRVKTRFGFISPLPSLAIGTVSDEIGRDCRSTRMVSKLSIASPNSLPSGMPSSASRDAVSPATTSWSRKKKHDPEMFGSAERDEEAGLVGRLLQLVRGQVAAVECFTREGRKASLERHRPAVIPPKTLPPLALNGGYPVSCQGSLQAVRA